MKKLYMVTLGALALATWAESPGRFEVILDDGHLERWEAGWFDAGFGARVWGREGGWTTGSLEAGPVLMGPLSSTWGKTEPWSWFPDTHAKPGSWGGVLGGNYGAMWLVQNPEGVRLGMESWGVGWQHSWPADTDTLRLAERFDWPFLTLEVQAEVVRETELLWKTKFVLSTPGKDLRTRWRVDAGSTVEDWRAEVNLAWWWWRFQAETGGAVDSYSGRMGGQWDTGWGSLELWLTFLDKPGTDARVEYKGEWGRVSASGKVAWDELKGNVWDAELGAQTTFDGSDWSVEAGWKSPAGASIEANLKGAWKSADGRLVARLSFLAPTGAAEWFGPDNHVSLTIETRF